LPRGALAGMRSDPRPIPPSLSEQLLAGWWLLPLKLHRHVLLLLAAGATCATCLFILFVGVLLHHTTNEPDADLLPLAHRGADGRLDSGADGLRQQLLPPSPSTASHHTGAADAEDWLLPLQHAAMLLLCYNRPEYLQKTLASLFSVEGASALPVYVSQDGDHAPTAAVARRFNVTLWQRPRVPLLSPGQQGQAYLAQHYKWALDRVLLGDAQNHSHAIVLEDDMVFSPDFVRFFAQTAWLLRADPTLWCVSSWNDNGFEGLVQPADASRLFRTDFFPGLGWMLRRDLWLELAPGFPLEHWDHWMRLDSTSRGRECAVPLVSRNFNIGVVGANMESSHYQKYLKHMRHNTDASVRLAETHEVMQEAYEARLGALVRRAAQQPLLLSRTPGSVAGKGGTYLYTYTADSYTTLADLFGVWHVPRAVHRHTAVLEYKGNTFVLASARHSPYLPEPLRQPRPGELVLLVGGAGEHCNTVCARGDQPNVANQSGGARLACSAVDFEWANQVGELAAHFPCERGFATVTGPDIPNYVVEPTNEYFQRCLVSEGGWTCEAKHIATRRLCPCAPLAARLPGEGSSSRLFSQLRRTKSTVPRSK